MGLWLGRVGGASGPGPRGVPPCSGLSRPGPSGGREDAASLDRPCARRLCDLAVGAEECSRRGSNKRMEPTYTISKQIFNLRRTPPASPCSVSFRIAVHSWQDLFGAKFD